jgi:type IV secretion system protein TrbJ
MKHLCSQILFVVIGLVVMSPVKADLPVIDGLNLSQNILTAGRMLTEVNNQITQLQHEVSMLQNQARNLTSLPFSIVSQLQQTLSSTTQLINQAQGLGFRLQQTQLLLNQLYPFNYSTNFPGAAMAVDALARTYQSLFALQTNVTMQSQAATNLNDDANYLSTLVSQSQAAVGILQTTQATNQLLALQSRQLIQGQQLRLTSDRSAALEQGRSLAAEARAREVRRRFEGSGTPYTQRPINFYGF